jgi:C4-dicarboxylate transporter DctQ subunit
MQAWIDRLHRAEDGLLAILLTAMILLAGTQILLRNLFDSGFVWIDPLLRVLVLWLGLIGATVATRQNKHIRIDLLSRQFKRNTHRLIQSLVGQVSAWTCLVIAWYGMDWIRLDYADAVTAFAGIPAWSVEIIVPLAFALIGLRYLLRSIHSARLYCLHRKVAAKASTKVTARTST